MSNDSVGSTDDTAMLPNTWFISLSFLPGTSLILLIEGLIYPYIFHNASSSIAATSFNVGSVSSNGQFLVAVTPFEISWSTITLKESASTRWYAAHDKKFHSLVKQMIKSSGWSGKCICFTCSRFSMLSFVVSHLPIVSTIIVQLNT